MAIPYTSVQHHVKTAMHELSGLDYVVDQVTAVRRVPESISPAEWLANVEPDSDSGTKRQAPPRNQPRLDPLNPG
jgi:hypothetical protein